MCSTPATTCAPPPGALHVPWHQRLNAFCSAPCHPTCAVDQRPATSHRACSPDAHGARVLQLPVRHLPQRLLALQQRLDPDLPDSVHAHDCTPALVQRVWCASRAAVPGSAVTVERAFMLPQLVLPLTANQTVQFCAGNHDIVINGAVLRKSTPVHVLRTLA